MQPSTIILRTFALIYTTLCLALATQAQSNKRFSQILDGNKNELITGVSSTLSDADFFDAAYASRIVKPYPVKNIVSLRLNETSPIYISSDFTDTVKLRIISKDYNLTVDSIDKIFVVNYKNAQPYAPVVSEVFTGKYEVTLKVLSITSNVAWNTVPLLQLENVMETQPDFTFSCTEDIISQVSFIQPATGADELPVYWQHLPGVDAYDLEWTFADSSVVANINPATLFRNNASRVTVSATSYKIPLLYDGKGSLFFRVRAVQEKGKGLRKEGTWSTVSTNGQGRFDFNGHERTLNWQATTSFAEEGKRKSVVQYYDGSLRSRQTVTKDNTRDTTIIAESFYDYQGRPVIQVLPAPSLSNVIQYTKDFNRGINGAEYDKNNYDLLANPAAYCSLQAAPLSTVSGTSQYYSSNNPDKSGLNKYIPDASGYPFTETEYTPDNTGRIKRQGGVGPDHKIGSGHETKYYYGGYPDQNELDMLFGTEAGDRTHYQKNMVRDANGQYSVSYVDMHGRTIATALAGKVPDSLRMSSLASSVTNFAETIADKTSNIISGLVMLAQKELLVPAAGTYNFKYNLDPQTLLKEDCNKQQICYSCAYDLQITITDDCGNQKLGGKAFDTTLYNISLAQLSNSCNNVPMSLTFSLQLEEGSYLVTKKLSINTASLASYRDSLFVKNNTCKTLEQFIEEQRTLLRKTLCPPQDCNTCIVNIGTWDSFRNKYMQSAGIAITDSADNRAEAYTAYKNALDACSVLCNTATEYDEVRKAMLLDMSAPSGQYADASIGTNDKYSIFFIISNADKTVPPPYTDNTITYLDENGKPDKVFDETTGAYVIPQNLTPEQFSTRFKSSWAEALLPKHPEYCKLLELEKHKASLIWDRDFENTETYTAALNKGYLNPLGLIAAPYNKFTIVNANKDPLSLESAALQTELQDSITKYRKYKNGDLVTMWAMASITGACNNTDKDAQNTCVEKYRNTANAFDNAMCDADKNMAWQQFRQYYLGIKSSITDRLVAKANCKDKEAFSKLLKATPAHTLNFNNATDAMIQNAVQMGNTQPTEAAAKAREAAYYQSSCEQYATLWVQQLKGCAVYDAVALNVIIPQLVTVCRKGSDADHPYGSRNISPDSTNTFKSFDEVIANYNSTHGIITSADCNADVITTPDAYEAQRASSNKPVFATPSTCECDKIKNLYNQYTALHRIGEDVSKWMLRTQQTTISTADFNTLLTACNAKKSDGTTTCYYLPAPVTLPPALQCYTAPPCATCEHTNTLYNQYISKYPNLLPANNFAGDSLQEVKNNLFASFMNNRLGFNKRAWEYLAFRDSCNIQKMDDNNPQPITFKITDRPLTVPSTGVPMPDGIDCWTMSTLYNAFINEFPDFRNGASFKMYIAAQSAGPAQTQLLKTTLNAVTINTSDTIKTTLPNGLIERSYKIYDSSGRQSIKVDYQLENTVTTNQIVTPQQKLMSTRTMTMLGGGQSSFGRSVDTTLSAIALFEWYFNSKLGYTNRGYTWHEYADWLVNCGQNSQEFGVMSGVPWSDTLYNIDASSIQNLWNDFNTYYTGMGDIVSKTITRDLMAKKHYEQINSEGTYKSTTGDLWLYYAPNPNMRCGNTAMWNGDPNNPIYYWNNLKSYFNIPVKDIPTNATINSASFDFLPMYKMYWYCNQNNSGGGGVASHYRNIQDNPTAKITQTDGFISVPPSNNPTGTDFFIYPVNKLNNISVTVPTFTTGTLDFLNCQGTNTSDFYGDQEFVLDATALVRSVQNNFKASNICYPAVLEGILGNKEKSFSYFFNRCVASVTYTAPRCDVFAATVNEKYNLHLTTDEVKQLFTIVTGQTISCIANTVERPVLCGNAIPVFDEMAIERHDNCADSTFFAISKATELYNSYRDSLNNSFENDYTQKCLQAINYESFTVAHPVTEFQYTLYYYGQDGNLLKTIPPAGVSLNRYTQDTWLTRVRAARAAGITLVPAHSMATQYRYNSLNQVAAQNSPDGGQSRFWYDRLGRLAISQNAEQLKTSKYSYTLYDNLGRITEVGQTINVTAMTDDICRKADALQQWMDNAASAKEQITVTVYDKPYIPLQPQLAATNLRARVAYTQVFDTRVDMDNNNAASATYYSYDIHGNVDTLVQDYKQTIMADRGNRFKKIIYNYDLISGKVNQVSYQPGQPDAFYHKYLYDAENRITDVLTSGDSVHWEKDAWYMYYKHGPLARTVLGQNQVQGIDYAYTLQGWLKSINPDTLSDGKAVAKKAYNIWLNYYGNDYTPIGSGVYAMNPRNIPAYSWNNYYYRPLFNGNISSMYTALPISDDGKPVQQMQAGQGILNNYQYDQLNRITNVAVWQQYGNSFNSGSNFYESFGYDPNGNITYAYRLGNANTGKPYDMDQLNYSYIWGTNKLDHIEDQVPANNYAEDIDNQQAGNYGYDGIGNLVKDIQAGITKIEWSVYGKIKKIVKSDGSTIAYTYDAAGNRIAKTTGDGTTVYVRDAQGNVLSIYVQKGTADLTQTEVHLYGSSRIGVWNADRNVEHPVSNTYASYLRSKKFFELTNDNDVKGVGNQQDYGMCIYDPRIGKFLSVDLLARKYPFYSTYHFAGNNPIGYIDRDGLEPAKNPKFRGVGELYAMFVVDNILDRADKKYHENESEWFKKDPVIKGTYSCGPNNGVNNGPQYRTDTKGDPQNLFNMKVGNSTNFYVDESNAKDYDNYERAITLGLLKSFVMGDGAENYVFPRNGIISSKFLKADVLNDALTKFMKHPEASYIDQSSFGLKELAKDGFRTGTLVGSITGFVGSAMISITPQEKGIDINIFNITSLYSGALGKEAPGAGKLITPKSYVRWPNKDTPYGNISQTFQLFIPYNTSGDKYQNIKDVISTGDYKKD